MGRRMTTAGLAVIALLWAVAVIAISRAASSPNRPQWAMKRRTSGKKGR